MSKHEVPEKGHYELGVDPTPAANTPVSLSQVLLAPLDAIFKAQVHAARSFLNLVLQLSYPDLLKRDENGKVYEEPSKEVYSQEFVQSIEVDGKKVLQTVKVPVLALVPIQPLAVSEASFEMQMAVESLAKHRQKRPSERKKDGTEDPEAYNRPWFLVDQPISVRGVLAPSDGTKEKNALAIGIKVKVEPVPMPAGLEKLLTSMGQNATFKQDSDKSSSGGQGT